MCSCSYLDHSLTVQDYLPNCRRVYKLVNSKEDSVYSFVHYLNEKSSNENTNEKTSDGFLIETPSSALSTSDEYVIVCSI